MTAKHNDFTAALAGVQNLSPSCALPRSLRRRTYWAALLWTLGAGMASAQDTGANGLNIPYRSSDTANDASSAFHESSAPGIDAASTPLLPTVEVQG